MIVNPSVPAKTVPEFIAYAKANPGKLNFGSGGAGTSVHMSGELFKLMTQTDLLHVPYRGESAALTDVIGGQLQVMFPTSLGSIPHIKSGTVRALAVTTPTRSETLPDLPAIAEFLPGYDASGWQGVCAPKGTAGEIVEKLNVAINKALSDTKIKARISDLGSTTMVMSPAGFGTFIANEVEKWAKVIRAANIKPG
jgi:tripartite-type tricarboxylate transporter receptor subunit TctC